MADEAATQGYGGFWIRFLAYLVDSVIVVVILFLAVFAAIFLGEAAAALIPAICLAVPVLYWGLMQASARQATFGKALLGLKVTDISGGRIPVLRSLAREVAKYISAIPLMIGFILAAFTKRKQALHDFFVSTTVVREGRAHVVAALMVGVFGWLAPAALMMFIGGTVLAVMMGIMGGGLMPETMKEAQKQAASPAPMPAKPAPAAPKQATPASAPAKPLPPGPPAMPPMAGPVADIQAALAARLSLVDKPGSTRAGPAILELDSLFGSSFAIKTYLPLRGEFDGDGVSIMLNRVVDAKGAELYDPSHSLESPFFQRVSLNAEASPEEHLDGTRRVSLKSGGGGQGLERAEGVLKLAIPAKATILSFEAADIGKPQSAHGVEVTVQSVKGNVFTFEYKGDASRVFSTKGFGADAKRVPIAGRGGGGQRMTYTFARPVSRIQVAVVENLTQHSFPFTLTRTSLAGPAGAPPAVKTTGLPATPREPAKPAPTAKPAPAPAPTVVAQARQPEKPLAAEPAAAPRKAAEPMAAPMQKAAPAQAAAPVQATQGPLIPGPRFNDLVTAVLYRDAKAVEDLLAFGKWPDKADSRGMTPLMLAAMLGDAPIAEALLKAGANPNRPGPGGDTAMSIARERKDTGMVGLLRQHGAR